MDMIQTKENREVKNSVFIDLFCYDRTAEDNVISLYNALHGRNTARRDESRMDAVR